MRLPLSYLTCSTSEAGRNSALVSRNDQQELRAHQGAARLSCDPRFASPGIGLRSLP